MVGVPTKNRCDNCRKRKKKCDEKIPSCSQCLASGWTCPGYSTPWKFVDETQQLAKYYASRKYVYDIIDIEREACYRSDELDDMEIVQANFEGVPFPGRPRTNRDGMFTNIYVPRYLEPNPLGSALVFCMGSKVEGTLISLHLVGSFFDFIPARMGFNTALDDAVSCLCSIYSHKYSTPYGYQKHIFQSYVRALSSLRGCLEDPVVRMESETLCASMLLQMCEVIVNVDLGKWSHLAQGTHLLLESRGVNRYKTAFDLAMLESQLGYIFSHSVKAKQPSFINSPEWQSVFPKAPIFPFHTTQPRSLTLRTQRWIILSELPALFFQFSTLSRNQTSPSSPSSLPTPPNIDSELDMLAFKAERLYRTIKAWLDEENETLYPTTYPDVISGVLDCSSSMALLALLKLMAAMQRARSRFSSPISPSSTQSCQGMWEDPVQIDYWRNRATMAFAFVQGKSVIASKVLDFGMEQLSLMGVKSETIEMQDCNL